MLPNVLPPTIAAIGAHVGYLVGGLVVVETLFSYPGLGKLLLDSAAAHDLASLEACVLATAVVVMAANLAADVAASALDPRLRRAPVLMATEPWQPAAPAGWQRQVVGRRGGAGLVRGGGGRWTGRTLLRSPAFLVGVAVLLVLGLRRGCLARLVPYDPQAVSPDQTLQPPSAEHWFGTDDLGRDVFSRVLAGATSVLIVAPAAAALAVAAGVAVGLLAGYLGGAIDEVLMRVVDALLAFPLVVGAVLVLAVAGVSPSHLVLVIAVVLAPMTARTVRAAVRGERGREYVEAARLRGDSGPYIMVAEILPNVSALVVAEATTRLAAAIFAAATLSFLGLGIQQPSPDWGLTVALGRVFLQTAPWIVLFPALALATLVVATTAVADGLRLRIER